MIEEAPLDGGGSTCSQDKASAKVSELARERDILEALNKQMRTNQQTLKDKLQAETAAATARTSSHTAQVTELQEQVELSELEHLTFLQQAMFMRVRLGADLMTRVVHLCLAIEGTPVNSAFWDVLSIYQQVH